MSDESLLRQNSVIAGGFAGNRNLLVYSARIHIFDGQQVAFSLGR